MSPESESNTALLQLDAKFERIMDSIENIKERQEDMVDSLDKIKEAVYNPDEGIYARIKELENWKQTQSKIMWIIVTTMIGVAAAGFFTYFSAGS